MPQQRFERKTIGEFIPDEPHQPWRNRWVTLRVWRGNRPNEAVDHARNGAREHDGRQRLTERADIIVGNKAGEVQTDLIECARDVEPLRD